MTDTESTDSAFQGSMTTPTDATSFVFRQVRCSASIKRYLPSFWAWQALMTATCRGGWPGLTGTAEGCFSLAKRDRTGRPRSVRLGRARRGASSAEREGRDRRRRGCLQCEVLAEFGRTGGAIAIDWKEFRKAQASTPTSGTLRPPVRRSYAVPPTGDCHRNRKKR